MKLIRAAAEYPAQWIVTMVLLGAFGGAVAAQASPRLDTPPWTSTFRTAYNTDPASEGLHALEWAHRNTSPNTFTNFGRSLVGAEFAGDVLATSMVSPTVALARLSDTESRDTLRLELGCAWEIPLEAASHVSGTVRGLLVGAPYSGEVTIVLRNVIDQEGRCP